MLKIAPDSVLASTTSSTYLRRYACGVVLGCGLAG
jgi:hypothetical protein